MTAAVKDVLIFDQELVEEKLFWINRLSDCTEPFGFKPLGRRHHDADSARTSVAIDLGSELCERLSAVTGGGDFLTYVTLMAGLKVCLMKYSDFTTIVVASPARRQINERQQISNVVAILDELKPEMTFKQLLMRVRETLLDAYSKQRYPFRRLLKDLEVTGRTAGLQLFDIMLEMRELHVHVADTDESIRISFRKEGSEIVGEIKYDERTYERVFVQRLAAHYRCLLKEALRDTSKRLSDISPFTEAERHLAKIEWNDTEYELPNELCIHRLFERQVCLSPEATAVCFQDHQISYSVINSCANRLAHHLVHCGVGLEDLVAVFLDRTPELIISLLASLKGGAAYLPLDTSYPVDRLNFIINDARPRVILTSESLAGLLPPDSGAVICLDSDAEHVAEYPSSNSTTDVLAENLAYVIYTSGSTGRPKGVLAQHASLVNLAAAQSAAFSISSKSTLLQFASLNFDASVSEIFTALISGAKLVLESPDRLHDPKSLGELIVEQTISVITLPPTMLAVIDPLALVGVNTLVSAGEQCSVQLASRHQAVQRFLNAYGPTEGTVCATIDGRRAGRVLTIGRAMGNVKVYVRGEERGELGIGMRGELLIGGVGVTRGYLNRPEQTAERFVPDNSGQKAGQRLYRTGDVVSYGEDGRIEYLGRNDSQVKLRGIRIEPGEIEAALREESKIADAVVITKEEDGEKILAGYIVAEPGESLSGEEVRACLREKLPEYMVPTFFVMIDEMPLTPNGKVDRQALQGAAIERRAEESNKKRAGTFVEEILVAIWEEVLRAEEIGINQSFFEIGGHSLLATQVMSRVRESLDLEMPLRVLFESPTIEQLGKRVEAEMKQGRTMAAPPMIRVSREEELALSFAQQRLWFLEQFSPGSTSYNVPIAIRLTGELSITALEHSLREVVRRHEVLRTGYKTIKGRPVQVIREDSGIEFGTIDLRSIGEQKTDELVSRLVLEESKRPFDLAHGRLFRATVLKLGREDHVVLLTMHHIVSDGWSMGLLTEEISDLYRVYENGHPSALAELEIQYADFAAWQRSYLSGRVLEEELGYWRKQLADIPAALALRTDRPRPAMQTFNGSQEFITIPEDLTRELKALSHQQKSTLFMTLLAAYQTLLHRYTSQTDVLVGTAVAGRNHLKIERLIGFFVNTLVIRGDFTFAPTFREYLMRVRETALEAQAHQTLPFEQLVDELRPERDPSRTPLIQTMFGVQNAPKGQMKTEGLKMGNIVGDPGTAKFDLTLVFPDEGPELSGTVEYNRDLFDQHTIRRMIEHFKVMLTAIITNPDLSLSLLSVLSEAERHQTLIEWNDTGREIDGDITVLDLFDRQVRIAPDSIAVEGDQNQVSYQELSAMADACAGELSRLGVFTETVVGVCLERSIEMAAALLGVMKAGGGYLPIDPAYPQDRIEYLIADSGIRLLITEATVKSRLPETSARLLLIEHLIDGSAKPVRSAFDGESLSYIIYTSGSTGKPKGVELQHRGLLNMIEAQIAAFGVTPECHVLQFASLSFDASVSEIFMALGSGARLLLERSGRLLPGGGLLEYLQERAITTLTLPPSLLKVLDCRLLPALHTLVVAGEASSAEHLQPWLDNRLVINAYGPTEITVCATYSVCEPGKSNPPIGRPINNLTTLLLDDRMSQSPIGVESELWIAGPGLARGYSNRPELTADSFRPHPHGGEDGQRIYRTGDLARYLCDGSVDFLGRVDHQVKVRGYCIELGEIEFLLSEHESVEQAIVAIREDKSEHKSLVACIVSKDEQLTSREVREFLKERLPEYMLPSAYLFLDALPLTENGKVDRLSLAAMASTEAEQSKDAGPCTPVEEIISAIYCQVLGLPDASLGVSFFEMGGHSLLATQVVSRISDTFGVQLPLRSLFACPTIEQLAERVEAEMRQGRMIAAPPMIRVSRDEDLALSFAQQRLWFFYQLDQQSSTYNVPSAIRLNGKLSVPDLEQSLREIVRRHEVLRTTFTTVEGKPVQVIAAETRIDFRIIDLKWLSEQARETEIKSLAFAESQRPFNLVTGPLIRASQLRVSEEDHVVLLTMHHIVSDGWSMGLLTREVSELYRSYGAGHVSPLEELEIQYADFAAWQRSYLSGEVLEAQLDYWRKQIDGARDLLDLPTDNPRLPIQSFRGSRAMFTLSAELTRNLRELSRREEATLFIVLLAAFKVLLYRYIGDPDIVIGTGIANRNRSAIEPMIGFFVNMLVLRTDLSGNPSYKELLTRVRDVALGAYTHQDLPFEMLVEQTLKKWDLSHSPLFQVSFFLQNAAKPRLEMADLSLSGVGVDAEIAHFDLTLTLMDDGDALQGAMLYNRDLFNEATIQRMVDHYLTMLHQIASDPEMPILRISLDTQSSALVAPTDEAEMRDFAF